MISSDDDNFDPYEFQQSQQVSQQRETRKPAARGTQVQTEQNVDIKNGFATTKDGFYLKESDDEEDAPRVALTRKQKKKLKHLRRGHADDSDDSTEDVLEDVVSGGNVRRPGYLPGTANAVGPRTGAKNETKGANLCKVDNSMGLSGTVNNALKKTEAHLDEDRLRNKDKSDRATVENCLDPRTMLQIEKMINNEKLTAMYGCISTGKEANVYRAEGSMDLIEREMFKPDEEGKLPVKEYAVKIFKTSILIFKDRERYVDGEFRFRNGHCKGNPRKMVKLWAEKEVRNLKRIGYTNGLIKVPVPYVLNNNIIVMEFIGENSKAAPRLRDAMLEDWNSAYLQTIMIVRRLYQRCRLIHADLSEYNLLYHKEEVWVIDVSQTVENDHPMALDFLRRDISIVQEFFARKLQRVLTTQDTFAFVTDLTIENDDEEAVFATLVQALYLKTTEQLEIERQQDDIFKQIYIPRTLQELSLDDIDKLKRNNQEAMFNKLTGVNTGTKTISNVTEDADDVDAEQEGEAADKDQIKTEDASGLEEIKEEAPADKVEKGEGEGEGEGDGDGDYDDEDEEE